MSELKLLVIKLWFARFIITILMPFLFIWILIVETCRALKRVPMYTMCAYQYEIRTFKFLWQKRKEAGNE